MKVVLDVKELVNPLPERLPEFDHGPPAVQLVALVEDQVSVDWPLYATEVGEAESEAVGGEGMHD